MPTLLDQYKAGPFEVSLTHSATMIMSAIRKQEAITAKVKSNNLFIFSTVTMIVKIHLPSERANHNQQSYYR